MKKYLRLNKSSTDSSTEGYLIVPLETFTGAAPYADDRLSLFFLPITEDSRTQGVDNFDLQLSINTNKHQEVIEDLVKEFATGENIYIDFDNETSTFPSTNITGINWVFSLGYSYRIGWHGSRNRIKILPRDFIADDGGEPLGINDVSLSVGVANIFSDGSKDMFATIPIPSGFKAIQVRINGNDTGQNFYVYKADIDDAVVTDVGTGTTSIGSTCDLATEVTSDATNYLLIRVTSDGSADRIHGGYVTIAAVYA